METEEAELNLIGSIQEDFSNELVAESRDLAIDYFKLGLDTVFNSTIIEEVPVVKTIAATYKMGLAIKERFFAKKILAFIVDFRSGVCDETRKSEFITKMQDSSYSQNARVGKGLRSSSSGVFFSSLVTWYFPQFVELIKGSSGWCLFSFI